MATVVDWPADRMATVDDQGNQFLTRAQVRRLDELAIQELGIPSLTLMENAGRAVAEVVLQLLRENGQLKPETARVAVVAGGGNNGGDGYVVARYLFLAKVKVTVYATKEKASLSGDTAVNAGIAQRMGIEIKLIRTAEQLAEHAPDWLCCQVIVDALLGTGFEGVARDDAVRVIDAINRTREEGGVKVVAVDIPSGLDCDLGRAGGRAVRADVTVTFVAMKAGFAGPDAKEWTGEVVVAGIGTPAELMERVRRL